MPKPLDLNCPTCNRPMDYKPGKKGGTYRCYGQPDGHRVTLFAIPGPTTVTKYEKPGEESHVVISGSRDSVVLPGVGSKVKALLDRAKRLAEEE